MRYRFYTFDNKILCVSSYAGKSVKASAKCDPTDEYDFEKGKELAKARCDVKISSKRLKRANQKLQEAVKEFEIADKHLKSRTSYVEESLVELADAQKRLVEIEESLK